MPHTTIAYAEANTPDGTFQKIDAVSDQHIRIEGTKVFVSDMNNIIGAMGCMGALSSELRLVAPSLRRINPFYVTPLEVAIVPDNPILHPFRPANPVPLEVTEALEIEYNGVAGAARQATAAIFLAGGALPTVSGMMWTINCTITLAQVVSSWEYSEVTFPDALAVGNYKVVGARVNCAGGVAFRFVPVGAAHRPGGVCSQGVNEEDPAFQRYGGLGEWFTFNTIQPPGIEIIGSAAAGSATYEVYIDVIKA